MEDDTSISKLRCSSLITSDLYDLLEPGFKQVRFIPPCQMLQAPIFLSAYKQSVHFRLGIASKGRQ